MKDWVREVLDFWFGLTPDQRWGGEEVVDAMCRDRFLDLHAEMRQLPPECFLTDARKALAAVLLFDQLARNMFRGHADQFMTDPLALAVAKGAVAKGLDEQSSKPERGFLYMPFQHSEDRSDQRQSLLLFTALGDPEQLRYARLHHDIIERFGRFPHRNQMLGRASRPAEVAAGDVKPW